jgi:hypothetical protein
LNRKILNKFIYIITNKYQKDQLVELFPSLSLRTSDFIANIDQRSVKDVIKNYLINENIIGNPECILFSVVYIFVLSLSLHPFQKLLDFLGEILHCFNRASLFARYYINILLQAFHQHFLINLKTNSYPEMNFDNMKMYYFFIGNYLKQKGIIPDEEMMTVLSNFFGDKFIKERDKKININNENEKDIDENNIKVDNNIIEQENMINNKDILAQKKEEEFEIKFKYNFFCFVKHAFTSNGILNSKILISNALNSGIYSKMEIKQIKHKELKLIPTIIVKILDYSCSSELFYPKYIMHNCSCIFSDFSENFNFDFNKINLRLFRSLIINLILYGLEMTYINIPFDFLIYTLYAIKDMDR